MFETTYIIMPDDMPDLLRKLKTATDRNIIFELLKEHASQFGFLYVTLAVLVNPHLNEVTYDDIGMTNLPDEVKLNYIKKNYIIKDPVTLYAYGEAKEPFFWNDLVSDAHGQKVMEESYSFGYFNNGLTVPIRLGDDYPTGLLSLAAKEIIIEDDDVNQLKIIAETAYKRLFELYSKEHAKTKPSLSNRQKEVLNYVANGKTDWEISRIMNISEHSVKEYLSKARKKLGANNRAHSVMIAIRDKHITL